MYDMGQHGIGWLNRPASGPAFRFVCGKTPKPIFGHVKASVFLETTRCCILISGYVRYGGKNCPNYSEPMYCLEGSLLWQEILGGQCFFRW